MSKILLETATDLNVPKSGTKNPKTKLDVIKEQPVLEVHNLEEETKSEQQTTEEAP